MNTVKFNITIKVKTKNNNVDIVIHQEYKIKLDTTNDKLYSTLLGLIKRTLCSKAENGLNLYYGHTIHINNLELVEEKNNG